MLCMETVIKVRRLHFKDKLSQRAIAERLGISRTTVRKYLKQELTRLLICVGFGVVKMDG